MDESIYSNPDRNELTGRCTRRQNLLRSAEAPPEHLIDDSFKRFAGPLHFFRNSSDMSASKVNVVLIHAGYVLPQLSAATARMESGPKELSRSRRPHPGEPEQAVAFGNSGAGSCLGVSLEQVVEIVADPRP